MSISQVVTASSSQMVTMERPLLLRRKTEDQGDVAERPLLLRRKTEDQGDLEVPIIQQPTPSHKRKQSDVLLLAQLDISQAEIKSAYSSLSPIEQGTAEDLEDDDEDGNDCSRRWKLPLPPQISPCFLVAVFVMLAAVATLRSFRAGSGPSKFVEEDIPAVYGYEDTGEPLEAELLDEEDENWIELYSSPERMPAVESKGPLLIDPNVGGLHMFQNVCLTNNVDAPKPPQSDTSLRGLVYFTHEKNMINNPSRCVPCSKKAMDSRSEDRWDAASSSDSQLGHNCGMKGLHVMFARDVEDYNQCQTDVDAHKSIIRNRQNQSPSNAKQIHFFREPTFVLQFDAHSRENALLDTLLTYLPHWYKFRNDGSFPFSSVISHSVQGCLTHSRNWFCELTHQAEAFGFAKELPRAKDSTLYCYKTLYYNQPGYQLNLREKSTVTKQMVDELRDELFRSFALPGPRDMSAVRAKDAKLGMKRPLHIALYANGETGWKGLGKLVRVTQSMKKYVGVEFNFVQSNLDDMTIAEQATIFNLADAIVMASGDHMANVIFSPDDSTFVEAGCSAQPFTSNKYFMDLLAGTPIGVATCTGDNSKNEICVTCSSDGSFSMTTEAFQALIDDIVKRHEKKISPQSDS